jgi:outer membrane protein OmpA-like peptidoglycan-associated protein
VRRSLSLFSSVVLAATSLVALSQSAVSANSTNESSIIRGTTVGPAAVPNAKIDRVVRLARTNQFLVAGRDSTNPNANVHLWRINEDLTIEPTFAAVDLGTDFSLPTVAQATCAAQQNVSSCFRVEAFVVNEIADRYIISSTRYLDNPTNNQFGRYVLTVTTGKVSTGEILTSTRILDFNSNEITSGWSSLNTTPLGRSVCESGTGTSVTVSGTQIPLDRGFANLWSPIIRSDGLIIASAICTYSNFNYSGSGPASVLEDETNVLFGLKQSGSTLEIDTSFGTNGTTTLVNDPTTCTASPFARIANNALKLNNLTDAYIPYNVTVYPRTTTVPSYMTGQGVTSYNGCNEMWTSSTVQSKNLVVNIQGTILGSYDYPAGARYSTSNWVIDPQGRWNSVLRGSAPGMTPQPTDTFFVRLTKTGEFDTTMGPNGMKNIQSTVPATVDVNGSSIRLNYSIMGFATTNTEVLYTGFVSTSNPQSWSCNVNGTISTQVTRTFYPYYLTPDNGLVTSFGTNGLGEPVTIVIPAGSSCDTATLSVQYITSKGQHALFAATELVGSQPSGLMLARFGTAPGVTGGGDGAGEVVGASSGRTDTKVYSRKLPVRTQVDTTLNVLTKKASRTQMLRTRTPKVCVALTQSVVLVKTGTCRVQIVDRATRNVVRSLSTRVRSTDATVGTTVNGQDAIRFSRVSTRLSASARAQIAELATTAAEAKRVILIGHTALLTENTVSNNRIALQRAARVKAELQKQFTAAGVKVPISIVSVGSQAPISTKKSEARQSTNRRVEVYLVP